MNRFYSIAGLICTFFTLNLNAQMNTPASYDAVIGFWGSVTNSNDSTQTQMWTGNSGIAPNVSESYLNSVMMDNTGSVIKFDTSGISTSTVNAPGFKAELDIMFHGFAADNNVWTGAGATTPPEFSSHAGDGFTYLSVHPMLAEVYTDTNRWMTHSTVGSFSNWDGSTPTSIATATANDDSSFNPNYFGTASDTITFTHGWDADPVVSGATRPNSYGELVFDVTSIVQDWVNGNTTNNGFFVTTVASLSYGEQINLLTMETDDRPSDGISAAGDAAPMLRLTVIPEPKTYAAILSILSIGFVLFRKTKR